MAHVKIYPTQIPAFGEVEGAIGGGSLTVTPLKTANYNAVVGDFVQADPSGGAFNVVMPLAANSVNGVIEVKNKSSSGVGVNVVFQGADTTDGGTTIFAVPSLGSVRFVSDGVSVWMQG